MVMESISLEIPTGPFVSFIKNFFKPGFQARNELFESTNNKLRGVDNSEITQKLFGYTTYPNVYAYNIPKGYKERPKPQKRSDSTQIQKAAIDFFSSVICEFDCTLESTNLIERSTGLKKASDIVDDLLAPLTTESSPSTILIGGKIGCGKSTLIAAIMYSMWAGMESKGTLTSLPIKIDLRETLKGLIDPALQDDYPNDQVYIDRIEEVLCLRIRACLYEIGIKIPDSNPNFNDIIDACEKSHTNPIFIFDELDTIYYSFCQASTNPINREISQHKIFHRFCSLVNYLLGLAKAKLRSTTYSPLVIIAARTSTLRLVQEVRKNQLNLGNDLTCHYPEHKIKIHSPSNDRIIEIIKSWSDYYLSIVKKNGNDIEKLIQNLNHISNTLGSAAKPDFSKNIILSVHGLRHLMKVLGKCLTIDESGSLLRMYIQNPNLLRIYQYLDGCELYSQTTEGVSNIFLINGNFKSEEEKLNNYLPTDLCQNHLQTYWLKYFIMKYICHRQRKLGIGCVYTTDVLDIFCFRGLSNGSSLRFEAEIVHLIILHATEVTHGRLLKIGINTGNTSTKIIASNRADTFDQDNLYWEFSYLFVCIEDDWLLFPKGIGKYFVVDQPWQRAFTFATRFHLMDLDSKVAFIKYKAERVLIFLLILEVALNHELARYQNVFRDLDKELGSNIIGVNYLQKKRLLVKNSITKFVESYADKSVVNHVNEHLDDFMKSDEFKKIRRKVESTFRKYSRRWNSFASIEKHMKEHHTSRSLKP